MSVAINSTNFPDKALRDYVKNTLAGGRSTLTDDMLIGEEHTLVILINLGIKDITGIDLIFVPNLGPFSYSYPVEIDISYNNISDFDVHALYQKIGRMVDITNNRQYVNFAGNEITEIVNSTYPYRFNLGRYISNPASRVRDIWYLGLESKNFTHDCNISGDILMMKESPRQIMYAIDTVGDDREAFPTSNISLYRDSYIHQRYNNFKRKKGESCNIQYEVTTTWTTYDTFCGDIEIKNLTTTLPVTWSISKGELPPGLSLNPSTGLISGTPT